MYKFDMKKLDIINEKIIYKLSVIWENINLDHITTFTKTFN